MIYGWWLSLLALFGYVPKAADKIEKAVEENRTNRTLEESARLLAEAEAKAAAHDREHKP